MNSDKIRDHNNERGYVHPDLAGRYAIGYVTDAGDFITLWTETTEEYMNHCERVKNTRKIIYS